MDDYATKTGGLPDQASGNYQYDNIGNLISDISEEIADVNWLVTGKVKEVIHTGTSTRPDLGYRYDSQGSRIEKITKPRNGAGLEPQEEWTSTLYVRSPQGDVIATYERGYDRYNGDFSNGYYRLENDELPEVVENVGVENPDLDDDLLLSYVPGSAPGIPFGQTPAELDPVQGGSHLAEVIELKELHLYGNRRLGYKSENKIVHLTFFTPTLGNDSTFIDQTVDYHTDITPMYGYQHRMLGRKYYEQSNHLGNVLAVVTDRKIPVEDSTGQVAHYEAQVVKAADYYPFGMEMAGRSHSTPLYRYGFNGKENDREGWGSQLVQDYGFRLYNPAIGRFLSVDPLAPEYPWYTPYQFAGNMPIAFIDLDGLENIKPPPPGVVPRTTNRGGYSRSKSANSRGVSITRDANGTPRDVEGKPVALNDPKSRANAEARFAIVQAERENQGFQIPSGPWYISAVGTLTGEGGKPIVSADYKYNVPSPFNSFEQITNDPTTLSDDYLAGVRQRILDGTSSGQDKLYATESNRRFKLRNGYQPVDGARRGIVYMRIQDGRPYIGKTATSWDQRYNGERDILNAGPFDFIGGIPHVENNTRGTATLLHDIENALIQLNGGPNGVLSNDKWSRKGDGTIEGSIQRGEQWLDNNVDNWKGRFDYSNN